MKFYYLSRSYKNSKAGKPKRDIEQIMERMGGINAGIKQAYHPNVVINFAGTLIGVLALPFKLPGKNVLVVQYPLKKFYLFVCRIVHIKRGKVLTVIHDIESLRENKKYIQKEIKRLNHSDYLIVHNESMKKWLSKQGYGKPMVCLELFDYFSDAETAVPPPAEAPYKVIYVGKLRDRKNRFLYDLEHCIHNWHFILYGDGFEAGKIADKAHFEYKGFLPSDELIATQTGHFGLVWDGDSVASCSGSYGDYLRFNNPHKTSLYLRCQLPVIIWSKAALAPFIEKNKVGLCINSLEQLDTRLSSLSTEEYDQMKRNAVRISKRLAEGYFLRKALTEVLQITKKMDTPE